jgi:hypothetical protein
VRGSRPGGAVSGNAWSDDLVTRAARLGASTVHEAAGRIGQRNLVARALGLPR